MIVLGISENFEAGVALVKDGQIISACNEERLTGNKKEWGWPEKSIEKCLEVANIRTGQVDHIALASITKTSCSDWENISWDRWAIMALSKLPLTKWAGGTHWGINLYRQLNNRKNRLISFFQMINRLKERGLLSSFFSKNLAVVDHHLCHCAASYYTSGFQRALAISVDAVGDGFCSRVYLAENGRMKCLNSVPFYHSPAIYYGYITKLLGWKEGWHEGEVMALAARGNKEPAQSILRERIIFDPRGKAFVNRGYWELAEVEYLKSALANLSRVDICAGIQAHLEEIITEYIRFWSRETGIKDIVLGGGFFANVIFNGKLAREKWVKRMWVHPNMTDGGLAVGGALALWAAKKLGIDDKKGYFQVSADGKKAKMLEGAKILKKAKITEKTVKTVSFSRFQVPGPSFVAHGPRPTVNEKWLSQNLEKNKLSWERLKEPHRAMAKLIFEKKKVAVVQGPMEYGPRALGHRSVLARCDDKALIDSLGRALKRDDFMPFAPVLSWKYGDYYMEIPDSAREMADFMTLAVFAKSTLKAEYPLIVHIDGTVRPQLIRDENNPFMARLLLCLEREFGIKVIVNTSFNIHNQPIVCDEEDALRAFLGSSLDCLLLEDYLLKKM